MIIVSQDKTVIVNLNQIECINIRKNYEGRKNCFSLVSLKGNNKVVLASYKAEYRAKEILQQISSCYRGTEAFKIGIDRMSDESVVTAIDDAFVYKMPLE